MQAPFAQESHSLMRMLLVLTTTGHEPVHVYGLRYIIGVFCKHVSELMPPSIAR